MSGWIYLITAILLEVTGTTFMKISNGFSRLLPSCLMVFFYILSFSSLTMALKAMDVSTAYAIWSGVGTALVAMIGFWYFHETVTMLKLICIMLIIAGVVGLQMASA